MKPFVALFFEKKSNFAETFDYGQTQHNNKGFA